MQHAFRFVQQGVPVAPWRGRPVQARTGGARPPAGAAPAGGSGGKPGGGRQAGGDARVADDGDPGGDPMSDLLADLRGRELTLQVGNRLLTGKLIMADPVVLVDGEGHATFVRPAAIVAVTF